MKSYCITAYRQMQTELRQCRQNKSCMHKMIESCFIVSSRHWNLIKQKLAHYRFKKEEHEIDFFKTLKPRFTSEIEYYCLLYHSLLFEPHDLVHAFSFWSREYARLEKFKEDNHEFLSCFKSRQCSHMSFYFLRKYCLLQTTVEAKMYDDKTSATNGDHLVARFMALKRYHGYAKQKMLGMNTGIPGSLS